MLVSQNLFARTYGGGSEDSLRSMVQTLDGGYALAGWTYSFGSGDADFLVIKLDSMGNLSWAKTYGGVAEDMVRSIIQTSDRGFAVAGWTYSFSSYGKFLVLKVDSLGDLSWARTFSYDSYDQAYSIIQTSDGGYAIAGRTCCGYFKLDTEDNFLVIKLDFSGNLSWARTFGGTSNDVARSIAQASDGGYLVAGYTLKSYYSGDRDILAIKLDSLGNLSWTRTFGGGNRDYARSIIQAPDGGYMIAGWTQSFGAGGADLLVLKLNARGNLSWAKTIGGGLDDAASSITLTPDGGYAITGWTDSFGAGSRDLLAVKIDETGNLQWARTFGGGARDIARSITLTTDGGYALAGYSASFGATGYDFLVLKLDTSGNYPDCVEDWVPTVMDVSPYASQPNGFLDITPGQASPGLTVTTPSLAMTIVCPDVGLGEERADAPAGITCFPVPGGAVFCSRGDAALIVYSPDGRMVYSCQLQDGQNRISLNQGVYIWKAGTCKGKVVIR